LLGRKQKRRISGESAIHHDSALHLTDEQFAEVRRRRAKKNPKHVSLAEARKRFS
jgi:hypothetical protein